MKGLSRTLSHVYSAALAVAGPLLLAGLLLGRPQFLSAGILIVMATPIVGVVIVTGAMAAQRDWPFTTVALLVLAILGSSLYAAAHLPRPRPAAAGSKPAATNGLRP